ncbi:hypothetical protein N9P17_02580 [Tateyamaria sp.]|nr:hypothetical protein [Tateyamaria sp.]
MKQIILRFLLTVTWIFFGGIVAIVFVSDGEHMYTFVAIGMGVGLTMALCWIFAD